ncbi:LacI family DNA-binding transcriptional regulator [Saccharibacillus sp. JS10]|uniref:LacI family DNA-binding transcriptional regulator n=1 Tax=Saccharibacillus sp. JS10 TaxID=2950552 RepID=UPI00210CA2BD|nr:LacI family DNA-binding transcriptional regulator [Saccharibacillus sp. JS10]MCQ4086781.1 LacI family transcriptional regulator [Saccharibacillus sp. JS10]
MVSIKDIAKKAGVSISTVSYALNGSSKVTDETSSRILAIAEELNYVPNAAARTLKKRESRIIGVFLTDFRGEVYGDLLDGVKNVLNQKGYDMIVCSGVQSHRMLPERMIDGAIILDSDFDSEEILRYADRGHRIVVMDRELIHPNINRVLLDNRSGAQAAMQHVWDQGHRKVYVVTGPEDSYDSNQRLAVVRQFAEQHQELELIEIVSNFEKQGGELAAKIIIDEYTSPVAVFCLNDEMAVGINNVLQDTNLQIGEHVHVIGFDNIELAKYVQPRLATVDYSRAKWGASAAEHLLRILTGDSIDHELIQVKLIEGASMGPSRNIGNPVT